MAEPPHLPFLPRHAPPGSSPFRNIPCRAPSCNRWFCNYAGLTQHMRAKHPVVQRQERPIPPPWVENDIPDPPPGDFDALFDEDYAPVEGERDLRELEHHPVLCGVCFHFFCSTSTLTTLIHSNAMR
jgi:hypothetical protein